jgi:hypothetical protein
MKKGASKLKWDVVDAVVNVEQTYCQIANLYDVFRVS